MLSLTDLFNYTSEKLLKNKLPAPVKKAQFKNILADNFYISGNPAFSLEARMNIPKQLYQQGRYEEARREYILLEKEYPDNQQLRVDHLEFERNAEFNKLVKDGDHFYFRDKNYSAAMSRYREALTIKNDESIRDKITDCMNRMKEQTEQRKEAATTTPVVEYEPMGMQQATVQQKTERPILANNHAAKTGCAHQDRSHHKKETQAAIDYRRSCSCSDTIFCLYISWRENNDGYRWQHL